MTIETLITGAAIDLSRLENIVGDVLVSIKMEYEDLIVPEDHPNYKGPDVPVDVSIRSQEVQLVIKAKSKSTRIDHLASDVSSLIEINKGQIHFPKVLIEEIVIKATVLPTINGNKITFWQQNEGNINPDFVLGES